MNRAECVIQPDSGHITDTLLIDRCDHGSKCRFSADRFACKAERNAVRRLTINAFDYWLCFFFLN
jgi:hypothetical protein